MANAFATVCVEIAFYLELLSRCYRGQLMKLEGISTIRLIEELNIENFFIVYEISSMLISM